MSCIHTICGLSRRRASSNFSSIRRRARFRRPCRCPSEPRSTAKPDDGHVCSFRTCYPVDFVAASRDASIGLGPNRFASSGNAGRIAADVAATIRIQMECLGGLRLAQLPMVASGFTFREQAPRRIALYESLFVNTLPFHCGAPERRQRAGHFSSGEQFAASRIRGGRGHTALLGPQFPGYRLLPEYFRFPEKILFFRCDRPGSNRAIRLWECVRDSDFAGRVQQQASARGVGTKRPTPIRSACCAPIVNLFERTAEPVRISQTKTEYRIIPDQHRQMSTEIYSVDSVTSNRPLS